MPSKEDYILYGVISSMWLELLWEMYLSMRQLKIYKHATAVPVELQGILTEQEYARARAYALDISEFVITVQVLSTIIITEVLLFEGFSYFWKISGFIVGKLGYGPRNEVLRSAAFMAVVYIFDTLIGLPFYFYYTFVLEEKHGFNKKSVEFFIVDEIAGLILTLLIVLPVTAMIIGIVKLGGDSVPLYLWLGTMLTNLALVVVFPTYIAPLLENYTPLPDGELKRRIEELGDSVGFPLDKIYIVQGSLKSTHSNAYFYGFFKVQGIVLYDTLLMDYLPEGVNEDVTGGRRGCTTDEVVAILAHELGHWKLNHFLKLVILPQLSFLLQIIVFGLLHKNGAMFRSFGFYEEKPILIGLLIVSFIYSPINSLFEFLETVQSRQCEFLADQYAKSLGKAEPLKSALIKLHKDNLILPEYDWLYSAWHHSHPPLLERLQALKDKED